MAYQEAFGEGEDISPVAPVYWSFRGMVAIGSLLLLTAFGGLFLWWRRRERLDTRTAPRRPQPPACRSQGVS